MRAPKTSEETSPDRRWLLGAAMSALVMAAALTGLVAYMVPASGRAMERPLRFTESKFLPDTATGG